MTFAIFDGQKSNRFDVIHLDKLLHEKDFGVAHHRQGSQVDEEDASEESIKEYKYKGINGHVYHYENWETSENVISQCKFDLKIQVHNRYAEDQLSKTRRRQKIQTLNIRIANSNEDAATVCIAKQTFLQFQTETVTHKQINDLKENILHFGFFSCLIMGSLIYVSSFDKDSELNRYIESFDYIPRRNRPFGV